MQSSITNAVQAWMLGLGLLPPERAATMAAVIATFCCRCSPDEREEGPSDPESYQAVARLLALLFCLDHLDVRDEAGKDTLDRIRGRLGAVRHEGRDAERDSWLLAVSELVDALRGPNRRDIEVFAAAFADHLDAFEEKAMARMSMDGAVGAPGAMNLCDRIDGYLRLRSLLVGTELYVRCWQTLLGCWPAPSLERTVASLASEVRRAHPHAGLDRALDMARLACARTPSSRRRSPALSEIDALAVALTYLANDLGSVDRDRRAGGPDQEPNIVLLLERYFLARATARVSPCPWDGGAGSLPATAQAEATSVAMYDAGVARFQALRRHVLAREPGDGARRYLSLLARIVDGNLESTIDLTGARASAASAGEPAPGVQPFEPRYGSAATLRRLRLIDEALHAR